MDSHPTSLSLPHGELRFPVYLPDATFGVVRSVDADDLLEAGIQAVVMNTFHLMQKPGSSTIQALGGLHNMSGWPRPILTDSGGFQAYSLIRQNAKFGSIQDRGISFQPEGSSRKFLLTPEKTVQLQFSYGADVIVCLDDCTHVDDNPAEQRTSVTRTVAWAKRCRKEFDRLLEQKKLEPAEQPKLMAVVQGGGFPDLRRECAESLLEIGFDAYGFGGWPLDKDNHLLTEIIGLTRQLIPHRFPMHALGVGHPENVLACWDMGYGISDSAMPTRDARHGRLYSFTTAPEDPQSGLSGSWLEYLYINDERHIKSDQPVSQHCDCLVCRRYSLGYLHHLFKLGDGLFLRLATLHNLRFMAQLCERMERRGR